LSFGLLAGSVTSPDAWVVPQELEGHGGLEKRQEGLVFHYMYNVLRHMDENSEPRLVGAARRQREASLVCLFWGGA
jgi:hypothetical protein